MADRHIESGISVVIPTRNRADRLQRALDSVYRQTMSPLEIIIVDDASTDQTSELLADFDDERVRIIRCEKQRGPSHARNRGIKIARGDMIAFLDDDDCWLPEKLAIQYEALKAASSRVGLVCSAYNVVSDTSNRIVKTWNPPETTMDVRYFLRTTGFMTTVPLVRATCLEQVGGFDEELVGGQDKDLWIRVAERFQVEAVSSVLAEHHIHGKQITTNLPLKALANGQILKKHRKCLEKYPDLLVRHLERTALLYCASGESVSGQSYLKELITLAPEQEKFHSHLQKSLRDPQTHANELIDSEFRRVDGISLFY